LDFSRSKTEAGGLYYFFVVATMGKHEKLLTTEDTEERKILLDTASDHRNRYLAPNLVSTVNKHLSLCVLRVLCGEKKD